MESLHAIAFTHKNIGIDRLGDFHIAEEAQKDRLAPLMNLGVEELIFLTTCNRVELLIRTGKNLTQERLRKILETVYLRFSVETIELATSQAYVYSHLEAVYHWFKVASSLDSLVIGEREILGQMRNAYQLCKSNGLNGDFMRILMQKTVATAKLIYTETEITNNPISVVNLAYKKLEASVDVSSARVLVVGAGKTNTALVKKMAKHGAKNFIIYNRTESKAIQLAQLVNGKALPLEQFGSAPVDFDVLLTCTGSEDSIITTKTYNGINPTNDPKVIVDLAVPNDVSKEVLNKAPLDYISVEGLSEIAAENLEKRKQHLSHCEEIIKAQLNEFTHDYKTRQVELAMRKVPEQIKEIKRKALEEVFVHELEGLDNTSKEVLDKVVGYLEKKYMSTPMLLAKEILLKEEVR